MNNSDPAGNPVRADNRLLSVQNFPINTTTASTTLPPFNPAINSQLPMLQEPVPNAPFARPVRRQSRATHDFANTSSHHARSLNNLGSMHDYIGNNLRSPLPSSSHITPHTPDLAPLVQPVRHPALLHENQSAPTNSSPHPPNLRLPFSGTLDYQQSSTHHASAPQASTALARLEPGPRPAPAPRSKSKGVTKNRNRTRHECPTCHREFKRAHNLKIHQRVHTGEAPFRCPFITCAKAFKWKSSIMSHFKWHTKMGDRLPPGSILPFRVGVGSNGKRNNSLPDGAVPVTDTTSPARSTARSTPGVARMRATGSRASGSRATGSRSRNAQSPRPPRPPPKNTTQSMTPPQQIMVPPVQASPYGRLAVSPGAYANGAGSQETQTTMMETGSNDETPLFTPESERAGALVDIGDLDTLTPPLWGRRHDDPYLYHSYQPYPRQVSVTGMSTSFAPPPARRLVNSRFFNDNEEEEENDQNLPNDDHDLTYPPYLSNGM